MENKKDFITVGYYKGEMDFGVNCSIAEFSYEEMKELREMICVAIGQAERMWGRAQEEKNSPSESLTTNHNDVAKMLNDFIFSASEKIAEIAKKFGVDLK